MSRCLSRAGRGGDRRRPRLVAICAAYLITAVPGRAAPADYKNVLVDAKTGVVEVRLPLTDVTGSARVKRRSADGFGVPIAPSKSELDASCYLEWQIGYDTTDANDVSVVSQVTFKRDSRTKYGSELTKILAEGLRIGLLPREELAAVRNALPELRVVNLEGAEKVLLYLEPSVARDAALPEGFERFVQKVPQLVKTTPHGAIEIQFKPKQRAVGYQPMVYVCLPLAKWRVASGALRGSGRARAKETVTYAFTRENIPFLLDIVRAFAIASPAHNEDLTRILDALLAE